MPTFSLGKSIDDVQEPELLEEDWFPMEIVAEPVQEMNKKQKDGGPDAEGAGFNIILKLKTITEDPMTNGRMFTKWLPLPVPGDSDVYTQRGQSKEDFKIGHIAGWATAFGNSVDGEDANFEIGSKAQVLIIQQINERSGELENSLNFFTMPRPLPEGLDPSTQEDDIPF